MSETPKKTKAVKEDQPATARIVRLGSARPRGDMDATPAAAAPLTSVDALKTLADRLAQLEHSQGQMPSDSASTQARVTGLAAMRGSKPGKSPLSLKRDEAADLDAPTKTATIESFAARRDAKKPDPK